MANRTNNNRFNARFIDEDHEMGQQISTRKALVMFRRWLDREITIDPNTAERPLGGRFVRVRCTLMSNGGGNEMIPTTMITGMSDEQRLLLHTVADDKVHANRAQPTVSVPRHPAAVEREYRA